MNITDKSAVRSRVFVRTLGNFIRLSASFIAMQFYYASHSIICFASFVENKITLCRRAEYHLIYPK